MLLVELLALSTITFLRVMKQIESLITLTKVVSSLFLKASWARVYVRRRIQHFEKFDVKLRPQHFEAFFHTKGQSRGLCNNLTNIVLGRFVKCPGLHVHPKGKSMGFLTVYTFSPRDFERR
ncbi:14534_t:CDS:2 [Funneliformis geosporum]|uniref:14534_t:CDS:1 n=1 Tax=Funneliformis geosporum TaxID=1117311 RepID=A0A9W4WS39_9GLOM|nr:14534_t:CDS:2 [Funneliformis geosporum]